MTDDRGEDDTGDDNDDYEGYTSRIHFMNLRGKKRDFSLTHMCKI